MLALTPASSALATVIWHPLVRVPVAASLRRRPLPTPRIRITGPPTTQNGALLGPEECRHECLPYAHARSCPADRLVLVQHPALAHVLAGVLLVYDVSMDLGHGVHDVLDVDGFGHAGPARTGIGGRIRGEHDAGAGGVEAIGGVADGADSGNVSSGGAAVEDGQVEVLPEAGLELERDFAYLAIRVHVDCGL